MEPGPVRSFVRAGHYYRTSDSCRVQRYRCLGCSRYFSRATLDPCYRQKKRRKNREIEKLLRSGVSMRECARLLRLHRTTVDRKKTFLALQAQVWLIQFRARYRVCDWQFDDMETFEHSKMKPLSITLAVENKTRLILGFGVACMPAKGLLAARAKKKYGPRADHRKKVRQVLFSELLECISPTSRIGSDQNPHYESDVKRFFPCAEYEAFKGRRGCVVGQGELKSGGYDPLFSLNHTCAMLRANMNRLFRRTWCTTKTVRGLVEHLYIYALHHNLRILENLSG